MAAEATRRALSTAAARMCGSVLALLAVAAPAAQARDVAVNPTRAIAQARAGTLISTDGHRWVVRSDAAGTRVSDDAGLRADRRFPGCRGTAGYSGQVTLTCRDGRPDRIVDLVTGTTHLLPSGLWGQAGRRLVYRYLPSPGKGIQPPPPELVDRRTAGTVLQSGDACPPSAILDLDTPSGCRRLPAWLPRGPRYDAVQRASALSIGYRADLTMNVRLWRPQRPPVTVFDSRRIPAYCCTEPDARLDGGHVTYSTSRSVFAYDVATGRRHRWDARGEVLYLLRTARAMWWVAVGRRSGETTYRATIPRGSRRAARVSVRPRGVIQPTRSHAARGTQRSRGMTANASPSTATDPAVTGR